MAGTTVAAMATKRDTIIKHARRDPAATDAEIAARSSASVGYVAKVRASEPGLRRRGGADAAAAANGATLRAAAAGPGRKSADDGRDATREAIEYLASVCDGAVALDDVGFSSSTVSLGHQLAALGDWTDTERAAALEVVWAHRKQLAGAGLETASEQPRRASGRIRDVAVLRFEKNNLLLTGIARDAMKRALGDSNDAVRYSQAHKAWVLDTAAAKASAGEKLTDWCLSHDVPVHITDSVPADIAAPLSARLAECRSDTAQWLRQLVVTDNLPGSLQAHVLSTANQVHYHLDADDTLWLWGHQTGDTSDPLTHTETLRSGVVPIGRTFDAPRPVAAYRIEGDHSAAAVTAALVRLRHERADAAAANPNPVHRQRREPRATSSTDTDTSPDEAEIAAAYEHLAAALREDDRIHSERMAAGAAARAAAETERAEQARQAREAADRRRVERRQQRRAEAWAKIRAAAVCPHTRTRDGRILVEVPPDSDGNGVYCVEHNGERRPVQASGRPFVARYGKLAGKRAVWAVAVPEPEPAGPDAG